MFTHIHTRVCVCIHFRVCSTNEVYEHAVFEYSIYLRWSKRLKISWSDVLRFRYIPYILLPDSIAQKFTREKERLVFKRNEYGRMKNANSKKQRDAILLCPALHH